MNRRNFFYKTAKTFFPVSVVAFLFGGSISKMSVFGFSRTPKTTVGDSNSKVEKLILSDIEWKKRLSADEYYVLREEGTERASTSPLNDEKRLGTYTCRGCDHELFTSEMKFDSGTGWPSFFTTLDNAFETSTDYKLVYPRTEYHCAKCGGHHGHVFKDGPPPTGQRWCNNGVALKFIPKNA